MLRWLRLWRLLHWVSGEGSAWASPQGPAVPPAQRDHSREGSAGRSLSLTWGLRYVFLAAAPMRDHKYTRDPQSVHGSYSVRARRPCRGMGGATVDLQPCCGCCLPLRSVNVPPVDAECTDRQPSWSEALVPEDWSVRLPTCYSKRLPQGRTLSQGGGNVQDLPPFLPYSVTQRLSGEQLSSMRPQP